MVQNMSQPRISRISKHYCIKSLNLNTENSRNTSRSIEAGPLRISKFAFFEEKYLLPDSGEQVPSKKIIYYIKIV